MASKSDRPNPMFKADDRSTAGERRDKMIFAELQKTRNETDAKTERLKALRLAKEAADAAELAANPPPPKTVRTRKAKAPVA